MTDDLAVAEYEMLPCLELLLPGGRVRLQREEGGEGVLPRPLHFYVIPLSHSSSLSSEEIFYYSAQPFFSGSFLVVIVTI
jgi:hypothetical protein